MSPELKSTLKKKSMKKLLLIFSLFIFQFNTEAQVQRIPLHEGFTSSTCGPCQPGNANLEAIYSTAPHKQNVLRYQMSWPGTGDPYYTGEGNVRRNFYGVNSIPRLEVDGGWNGNSNSYTATLRDVAYNVPAFMTIGVDHQVVCKTVNIDVEVIALQNFSGNNNLFVAIYETETYNNLKSNGETIFVNVMKKMVGGANGTSLGAISNGDTINYSFSYTFNGDYRLPPNANDPINNGTEHSVEEFFDLGVVAWVQNTSSRQIHQSAYGVSPTKVDVGMTQVLTPKDIHENSAPKDVAVVFQNYEDTLVTSATIKYQMDNGPVQTRSYSGLNLSHGDSIHVRYGTWTPQSPGTYTMKFWIDNFNNGAIDEISCNDTIIQVVTVHQGVAPIADWDVIVASQVGIFTDKSIPDPFEASSYLWDFGDGTISTSPNTNHFFTGGDGIYSVCLVVSNSTGSDTLCKDVQIGMVGIESSLEAQIKFYPNPTNGIITLENRSSEPVEVMVYNLRGEVIAEFSTEREDQIKMDLSSSDPGLYIVKVKSPGGEIVRKLSIE